MLTGKEHQLHLQPFGAIPGNQTAGRHPCGQGCKRSKVYMRPSERQLAAANDRAEDGDTRANRAVAIRHH